MRFYSTKLFEADRHRSIYERVSVPSKNNLEVSTLHSPLTKIDIYTDNRALSWLFSNPKRMLKYGSMIEELSQFKFKNNHIRFSDNKVADFFLESI